MELIFKDRKFWPLFWTQFLGALNDNFFKNALVMLITFRAVKVGPLDGALLVPLAGGIFIFPFFLFSATAGQMADKFQKSKMIKHIKLAEIFIMALASLGLYIDNYILLLGVLFLMGTQSAFFGPLKYGIIPSLVKSDKLVLANAFVSAGTFIAILIGTITGGAFVAFDQYVLALSIGLLLLAGIGYLFSLKVDDVPIPETDILVDYTFIKPTWDILRLTMRNREVFITVLGISWYWFLGAATLSLLPLFVKNVMNGGTQVATFFLATFTVGMGLGAFLTERISDKKVEIGLVPISALGMSLFLGLIFLTGSSAFIPELVSAPYTLQEFFQQPYAMGSFLALLGMATFGGGYIVPQMSHLQIIAKPSELSQTIAGNNIWNALLMVIAAILVMVMTKTVGITKSFLILGLINLIISFPLYAFYSQKTLRLWMRFLSKIFYRVEVIGEDDFPEEGPVIIVCNHVSFVDWMILMGAIKRPIHFVIDWNYYYLPTGPFWFRQAGLVPIATRKESEEVMKKAFDLIYKDLEEGSIMGLFPEGWITRDGKMRRFQPGVNKILKEKPVPVVLAALDGLWGSVFSFSGGKVLLKFPRALRPKITLNLSKPIMPADYDAKKAELWISQHVSHYKLESSVIEGEDYGLQRE
ncbi:MAG: MFS transporter [Bacteriovoracaceae bacterium]|nr:MFS transporter [Bacteriovoracaceae bacterium]